MSAILDPPFCFSSNSPQIQNQRPQKTPLAQIYYLLNICFIFPPTFSLKYQTGRRKRMVAPIWSKNFYQKSVKSSLKVVSGGKNTTIFWWRLYPVKLWRRASHLRLKDNFLTVACTVLQSRETSQIDSFQVAPSPPSHIQNSIFTTQRTRTSFTQKIISIKCFIIK